MCSKCGKVNISGVPQYRAQISVYDNSEQAVFVLLGDAGFQLTGKQAAELVSSYFEANGDQGVTQEVPFPEALISTIGQKHNFCVKVTKHNLDGKSRSLTVTKILPLDTPPVTESSGENYNPATSEETFETGTNVCEASKISVDSAEGKTNKTEPPSTMDHHHESYSTRDETLCFQRPSPQTVYVMYQVREVWNVSKAGPPRLTTTGSDLYRVSREPLEKQGMSTNHHHQP
ncbi:BnaA08g13050D [Brassica napus]|uniref:BnaA08g13050D protein n=1 Tax=Brassica napus TaxID=3708 RepID=A0A078GCY0_BRANA|nr:BnaA08g13050D [Brassica napus]